MNQNSLDMMKEVCERQQELRKNYGVSQKVLEEVGRKDPELCKIYQTINYSLDNCVLGPDTVEYNYLTSKKK